MADIDIRRQHSVQHDEAKQAAESIAQRLKKEFDLQYAWKGDCIVFQRSGVKGQLQVAPDFVRVQAKLGMALKLFRGKFETEINRCMDDLFKGSA